MYIATTGLRGENDKVTEICILNHDGSNITDRFYTLVNPEIPLDDGLLKESALRVDRLSAAPKFYEIAKKVMEFTKDRVLISHFVNFHYQGLKKEYIALGGAYKRPKICTARLSRKLIPGQQSYSLGAMCTHLGIMFQGGINAQEGAEATLLLLEKLWELDTVGAFHHLLSARSLRIPEPPLWPKTAVSKLPNSTGVYYFKNSEGVIIYVGKAKDIKQRVLSHRYSRDHKEMRLCFETTEITYTITGSELLALLLESDEIKKHTPKYNRAQKRTRARYGIGTYIDKNGIVNLTFGQLTNLETPILHYYTASACRDFLEELCKTHQLCLKYCDLQKVKGPCFQFHLKSCKGICTKRESVEAYNDRVEKVLEEIVAPKNTYVIKGKGRVKDETSFVLVEEGIYKGFGYLPFNKETHQLEGYTSYLVAMEDNLDVQRIIKSYLRQGKNKSSILKFGELCASRAR
ncbi:3'-5' exonuclease [Arenibacter amylolyticus]|uniref:3'-5' exonuclease n=1 Tax=Arenibacter amylolyticus TaxID=1406873 RepID=UPI000A375B48|nr:3'-5' exonuclease [Arenibacter amylolyticus]